MPRASQSRKPAQTTPPKSREPSAVLERHQIVANALMEGYSESDAMRAAGYHPSAGNNVIRAENIQTMLAQARAEVTELTTIKRLDVLNLFMEAIDMARTMADPSQMINGADKIAKMMGYYAPETKRIEVSQGQTVMNHRLKTMTDQELMDVIAGKADIIDVVDGEVAE